MERMFVTVGTTEFDLLVETLLQTDDAGGTPLLAQLVEGGVRELVLQIGRGSALPLARVHAAASGVSASASGDRGRTEEGEGVEEETEGAMDLCDGALHLSWYRFKNTLAQDIREADVVVAHAGAGTVMECLGLRKVLVVVVNDTLMHNHQTELASALADRNHLVATTCSEVGPALRQLAEQLSKHQGAGDNGLTHYPPPDLDAFPALVDEEMGVS